MPIRLRRLLAVATGVATMATLAVLVPARAQDELPPPPAEACDPSDPAHCLLPFPNDHFTVADESTGTGRRVDIHPLATPRNTLGMPIQTDGWTAWNANDGFSPGTPILTYVPGLDLHVTWGETTDHLTDIARYQRPDAPILLINASTGERHPFWSEVDQAAARPYETGADRRVLIVRPAVNLDEGARYLVALRNMREADGSVIPRQDWASRTGEIDRIIGEVATAETARGETFTPGDVYLAWEFTVASRENLTGRVLAMRDDAFARLGDPNLADRVVEGDAPVFTVDKVIDRPEGEDPIVARTVRGYVEVPSYLTPDVTMDAAVPGALAQPLLDAGLPDPLGGTVRDAADSSQPVAAPRNNLHDGDGDGLPDVNPLQPTLQIPYECHIPRTATAAEPAIPSYYGHGLLGSKSQSNSSSTRTMMATQNVGYCAVEWMGMSLQDLPNIATVMHDLSNFPSFADRIQQGFVNQMFLGRLMAHSDGFTSHPAFQDGAGAPLLDRARLVYDGNSQGGIMGAALMALSPDVHRGNLGVPGINYSTLLNRSVDWEGLFAEPFYPNYRDKLEQQILFALMQMLWDRAEGNGYAHHLTDDPLPNTPSHEVMLQIAFADHQVTNVAAEVLARTADVAMKVPMLQSVEGGQPAHWSVDPTFGLRTLDLAGAESVPGAGSVALYWYSEGIGNVTPPTANVPSDSGSDPHSHIRQDVEATRQKVHWLLTGELLDVCGGTCVTSPDTRT